MTAWFMWNGNSVSAQTEIDFNRDIRPLLATHCLACHGPDESSREAGLRLDQFDRATAEAESGERPLVPGKPDQSELLRRVRLPCGDDEKMPPSGSGLSEAEISKIEAWIRQGAGYQRHWAFEKPARPKWGPVSNPGWSRGGIDRFVQQRLDRESLVPTPAARRHLIARRVHLDLLGVPPTVEAAEQFVKDRSPDAYERMVDRVLAAPKFGERWARVWLDLARYADSQGYAQDSPRTIYRYRDWVIEAINRNLPFDQFSIEQLAGDMLPNPTDDQILATAFHRNTMTNSEGGTDDEEFRTAAVVDRVNTTMQVWMGMTMGCAQCHTHKYDPISQKEYFRVFAILNQTEDADRGNEAPLFSELSPARLRQKRKLELEILELEKNIATRPRAELKAVSLPSGEIKARFVRVQGIGEMFLHLAEVQAFEGERNVAPLGKARQSTTAFDGPARFGNDGQTDGDFQKKSVTHTAEETDPWWEVDLNSNRKLQKVVVWNRTDNEGVRLRLKQFRVILLDEKRNPVWTRSSSEIPNPSLSFPVPATGKELSAGDRKQLLALMTENGTGLSAEEKKLKSLRDQLTKIAKPDISTPIMKQLPEKGKRQTRIHIRGNFRSPGEVVTAGVPGVFHPLEKKDDSPDRLDFARWLVSRENPVTARVIVNRFWEQLFGTGIVETSEDFGTQGGLPSHPELLDHLAVEFMAHDWDVKWLLKSIVCSATYRQSSRVSPQLLKRDPRNRLLARGPRVRLSAEMIRDQALFVSGTLSTKMNGPSVRPPRPKLGLRAAFGGSTDWEPSPGEDAYRRGLYTTWRRTSPYPSMTTFDAPSREFCTIRRSRTNTPLQALVTLNDPVFVNAARSLAREVMQTEADPQARLAQLFRKVLIRPPASGEIAFLLEIHGRVRQKLSAEDAQQLAGPQGTGIDSRDLASWVVISNVVLNLDETLARP
ncbi:MAG: DUF1553 domain-containing protein [Planctomycetota bacterium]|nr:DUF1553 domain-containing protein [Planctomycetota bacterium]